MEQVSEETPDTVVDTAARNRRRSKVKATGEEVKVIA